ncbi:ABC-2 family transporter protein [Photobacterium sp. GJ3]|uniref:ABC-2 family transporter protein n=1 Tax=Photobacterium sp. GJ3 TaxID=2829502 RepID=UPI0035303766
MSIKDYKLDFCFSLLYAVIETCGILFLISFIMNTQTLTTQVSHIDILLFVGIYRLTHGLVFSLFMDRVLSLANTVRSGELDSFLTVPRNAESYYFLGDPNSRGLPSLFIGLILIALSQYEMNLLTFSHIIFCQMIAVWFIYNIFVSIAALLANVINSGPLNAIFTNYFSMVQISYMGITGNSITALLFLPFTLVCWFPYQLITTGNLSVYSYLLMMLVTSIFLRKWTWHHLLKHYNSANA